MSSNAQQFAATVLAAFRDAGHYTDQEIVDAGGPSTTTLTNLRKLAEGGGTITSLRGDTLRKIDKAAEWKSGSARALWHHGAKPIPAAPGLSEVLTGQRPSAEDKRRAMLERYRSGDSLEAQMLNRLLEVEERLDLLETRLSEPTATLRVAKAADADERGEQSAVTEQGEPDSP